MRKLRTLVSIACCFTAVHAQVTLKEFSPLTSSGTIPQDLIRFYLQGSENSSSKSSTDFILHNTVEFGNLFASGKIIFNDPLSKYAKKILDTILYRQPQVREKMRIYTLKSAVTNAYTTNDGKIFITTGLFARLQNEAELAFVLSHEIIHYLNNHAYESYVFNRSVDRKRKVVNTDGQNFEDQLLTKFRHSRTNEFEADKQGLLLYLQTEYTTAVIDSVFKLLDYSELPAQNIPFDKSFFESPYFHIREEAWLEKEKVLELNVDPDFKESRSSHPNSKSRKAQIQGVLDKADNNIGFVKKLYLYPEDEFTLVRDLARFDLSHVFYLDHNYEDAIYNSWLLLKQYPDNLYLRKTISRCLNGLLVENSYRLGLYDHNKKRGYISQLAHLVRFSDREEVETMALIFTWKTYVDHKEDNDLKTLLNKFFGYIDEKEPTYFYRKNIADIKLSEYKTILIDSNIVKDEKQLKEEGEELYRRTRFADLLADADFSTALQQAQLSKVPFDVPMMKLEKNKMFVIPLVYVVDSVSGKKKFSDPQQIIGDYSTQMKELADEKNLQLTFMSTYDLKPGDVDRYNEYSLLSDWVSVNQDKDVQSFVDYEDLEKLGEKYRSKYLCLSGVYLYRNTPGFKFRRWLMFTLLLPPVAGVIPGTAQLFTANYSAYYSTVIYDMETGQVVSRTSDASFSNSKPRTKKKNFWHTLKPWFNEKILGKEVQQT